jgi:hypothetical protein
MMLIDLLSAQPPGRSPGAPIRRLEHLLQAR